MRNRLVLCGMVVLATLALTQWGTPEAEGARPRCPTGFCCSSNEECVTACGGAAVCVYAFEDPCRPCLLL